ncbi:tetratricopeptide repeat protein [Anabaena cylindrica FACHB-243]|uniref:NB-ARC domain protein n=1 Tax=Anabaena cylindrica (strain ATCC 27899 / PCC 7122) TaxID=272123 RepID=K9ZP86_ANACC|nr:MULTISPECIES: tetratricopeptide repeat protein [Anabaena]AFZ61011.1 NB-ARC domain protein [Anabaena cylindrica PCC 7122]MBD2421729.1 tetratricopeptide repeat protein [Anabaena cylindrica FACHB-243]MBY5281470.1 ATP-binding protein [Anabaena sp. CCAP 1446/1C]MBY5309530.1 ATP-binding protein [Anabaena sp. CCAP 1446/1C]MCM2408998.1 tetratricopeptide repeat protein [Anabaena sp. CCAP 1446/1C]
MSSQSDGWNMPKTWYRKVLKDWDVDRLLTDLEAKIQERYRQNSKKDLLLGLLCGYSLKKLCKDLHKGNAAVRTVLSNIYRDIETLTGEPNNTVKSSNLVYVLERHGYRRGYVVSAIQSRSIPQNLPSPTYTEFIGREADMKKLLERLSPDHGAHMITVHGIGGVGKTALVLEAAYVCLKASRENLVGLPRFNAIIFTSAKQQELIPDSILRRQQGQRNLRDIFREIAHALGDPTIIQSPPNDQFDRVRQSLSKQRTLLIVDNMETIEDRDQVIEFLYNLPICVKVVITTRERIALLPISLRNLPPDDGLQLIQQQAEEKSIVLNKEESELLYDRTGGIPLAIVYAIGQVSSGYSLNSVLEKLTSATGDVARFCFEQSVQGMKEQPPHKLLMALAIFPDSPIQTALVEVAGLTAAPVSVNDGLARLQQLSLVNLNPDKKRYEMLSLTREYALAELAAYPDFEKEARQRWVKWYLDFAHSYAGEDWEKWIHYNKLEQEEGNLRAVLYWCKDQDHYQEVRDLWLLLNHYANLYAYWDDRLDWLKWLIEQSERRGEWSSLVKIMIRKTWLLIRECSPQSLKDANEMLQQVWVLREHTDLCVQADLAENIVRLRIRQNDYTDARVWLDIEQQLVNQANLEEQKHIRHYVPILYHRAVIFYREHKYTEAKTLFQEVMHSAEKIAWYRVINSAQNWLADIAIEQGDRDRAQQLLIKGLTVAQSSKNKRRLARYQRSLARWEKKWGSLDKARQLSTKAMDSFKHLGMIQDAQEMQFLLDSP